MLIPTDAEFVDAAALTYKSTTSPLARDIGSAIQAFLTIRDDGMKVIAIEGTHDTLGWLIDFFALPVDAHPVAKHPTLGILHAGFYASALILLPKIALAVGEGSWVVTGHSLGAGLALLIAALMGEDDHPPARVVAFAPPRVGGQGIVDAIAAISSAAYRFGNDPVTDVPFTVPPDFDYRQVPLIGIGEPMLDAFKCHHIENYVAAVKVVPAC